MNELVLLLAERERVEPWVDSCSSSREGSCDAAATSAAFSPMAVVSTSKFCRSRCWRSSNARHLSESSLLRAVLSSSIWGGKNNNKHSSLRSERHTDQVERDWEGLGRGCQYSTTKSCQCGTTKSCQCGTTKCCQCGSTKCCQCGNTKSCQWSTTKCCQ